jgi:hypothetical protein
MQHIWKRHGLLIFALWAGVGEMARAVRIEPWSFKVGPVHVHPVPIDVRFQEAGLDGGALLLGLTILLGGLLFHRWRQPLADPISGGDRNRAASRR